eukprot:349603-Chlamydomonas_euryale.AAC.1
MTTGTRARLRSSAASLACRGLRPSRTAGPTLARTPRCPSFRTTPSALAARQRSRTASTMTTTTVTTGRTRA